MSLGGSGRLWVRGQSCKLTGFSAADAPGWTAPGEELRQHFDDRFLAVLPPGALVEQVSKMAADLRAEKVMYVGAATSLLGIIIDIVTVSATKTAIEKRSPRLSVSQVNSSQHVLVAGFIAGGVIAAVVWIVLARASKSGHNWARITGTVLFALSTVDTIVGLTAPIAGPAKIWGGLVWLVALTAIVFLWRPSSTAFFKRTPS